ncbi:MAG: DUF3307 domain-containing protein [Solirubrobacteraceae bacterium]
MGWVAVFVAFAVSHMVGDYLFQTDWQACNKHGGLSRPGVSRRALCSHVATYTLAYVPALIWLAGNLGGWVVGAALLIGVPHLVQDDGRLIGAYMARVKHLELGVHPSVDRAVDQSFHIVALFLLSLVVGS